MTLHTVSAIKTWRTCKRRYRHQYVDMVRLALEAKALLFGGAFHVGLELVWNGFELATILASVDGALKSPFWSSEEGLVERRRLRAMLRAYFATWAEARASWEIVETEKPFAFSVFGSRFGGKRDALMRFRATGELYLVEYKTSSEEIATVGDTYWQRLALDTQLTAYQWAVEKQLHEKPEILYDVSRKPGGDPRLKERVARRKGETDEALATRKAAARETLDEFEARLVAEMLEAPGDYLVRRKVHRLEAQTGELLVELLEDVKELDAYHGAYPRNDGACASRFGLCPYLGVCSGVEALDSPKFVRLTDPHPELEGALNPEEKTQDGSDQQPSAGLSAEPPL